VPFCKSSADKKCDFEKWCFKGCQTDVCNEDYIVPPYIEENGGYCTPCFRRMKLYFSIFFVIIAIVIAVLFKKENPRDGYM